MPYKLTLFQNNPFFFDSLHRIFIGPTGTFPVSHTATQNVSLQSKVSTPLGNDSVGHRVWSAFNLTFPSAITLTTSNSALISSFEVKNQFSPTQTPNAKNSIFDVHYPGKWFKDGIILNNFWSSTIWVI